MRWLGACKALTFSLLSAACARGGSPPVRIAEPAAVVDELLAADRGFSAAAARTEAVAAITAMLADDVAMPTPRGQFARGRSGVADALRPALGRAGARARWTPIGLGPAFAEYGSADAVNMGGRDSRSFIFGSEAIGRMIGAGSPQLTSPVSWSADRALVASSGDLGVTFGVIRPNASPADGAPAVGFPFFTIWRRPRPTAPWRYVAE